MQYRPHRVGGQRNGAGNPGPRRRASESGVPAFDVNATCLSTSLAFVTQPATGPRGPSPHAQPAAARAGAVS